jgi:hypothetical protein
VVTPSVSRSRVRVASRVAYVNARCTSSEQKKTAKYDAGGKSHPKHGLKWPT